MTVTGQRVGHPTYLDPDGVTWRYSDTHEPIQRERACQACGSESVCLPLNGKVQSIDACIHHLVAALNAGGAFTKASCCGHEGKPLDHGRIDLEDGRVLVVLTAEEYDRLHGFKAPRELLCQACRQEYVVWFAPNALWNRVMRLPDGSDRYAFLCPTCFTKACDAAGESYTAFRVEPAGEGR